MFRIAALIVAIAALIAPLSPSPAQAQFDSASPQDKLRMATLSELELADIVRVGTRGQAEAAVQTLAARRQGALLLGLAGEGPRLITDIILENYVPKAIAQDGIKLKESVDQYLAYLEVQLKSESPLITPERAVRSLGRVAYWVPAEYVARLGSAAATPGNPRPEPRYQHDRVVADLLALLQDQRTMVSDAAANWLGNIAGYAPDLAKAATTALTDYRTTVAAERPATDAQVQRQKLRLGMIDAALGNITKESQLRADAAKSPGSATATPGPTTARTSP